MKKQYLILMFIGVIITALGIFAYIKNYINTEDPGKDKNVTPTISATNTPVTSTTTDITVPKPNVPSSTTTTYTNTEYGFTLTLPRSWTGYTASTSEMKYGNKILIRSPLWTSKDPHMDVPILVYTLAQWEKWEKNNFEDYPTAAPIGPTERGHNDKYVFATAPRYNFSYLTGFEEVDTIVQNLKAF